MLNVIPYAAPLHPKWSRDYYHSFGPDIPVHLNAFRQNHNKTANLKKLEQSQPEFIICTQNLEVWEKEHLQQIAPIYELPNENMGWEMAKRYLHLLSWQPVL